MPDRPATPNEVETPIINSPFAEPRYHWRIAKAEVPVKAAGRRPASYFYRVPEGATRGRKGGRQLLLLGDTAVGQQEDLYLVNWIRGRLAEWRAAGWPGTSDVTRELLRLWRGGSDQRAQRLFFAQIEAAETIIFLVEGAETFKRGMPPIPVDEPGAEAKAAGFRAFTRYACKMATGTGKTTVMGMLAAWSILNRVAEPTDDRFSDTVLVVCPNVTIRERLKELDPALGDLSLYRTRQLVPPQRMEDLRRGEVMIANWHRLAKKESGSVNGDSARVVKTGEAAQVVKNAGKSNETVETRWFESDRAWFKRIRQELGSGRGRCPHWLVFNDEAHHAYRRGDAQAEALSLDEAEDEDRGTLAKKNAREATIWIEGLDRINKLAGGGRRKGIRLCLDLSATPFYIQGSGNEVGKPLPWVVSDFGLLDAIESGLVKVPQLPTRDIAGTEEASYFNIWRWVEYRAEQDGHGTKLTPELVMTYATAPINQLAQGTGRSSRLANCTRSRRCSSWCAGTPRWPARSTTGWPTARAPPTPRPGFATGLVKRSRSASTPRWSRTWRKAAPRTRPAACASSWTPWARRPGRAARCQRSGRNWSARTTRRRLATRGRGTRTPEKVGFAAGSTSVYRPGGTSAASSRWPCWQRAGTPTP